MKSFQWDKKKFSYESEFDPEFNLESSLKYVNNVYNNISLLLRVIDNVNTKQRKFFISCKVFSFET